MAGKRYFALLYKDLSVLYQRERSWLFPLPYSTYFTKSQYERWLRSTFIRQRELWISDPLYRVWFMPGVNGKRISKNVYAKTQEECEEKLTEPIKTIRAEIAEMKKRRRTHNAQRDDHIFRHSRNGSPLKISSEEAKKSQIV